MAIITLKSLNFIDISLDSVTNIDLINDLVSLGLLKNAPNGLRVQKIVFIPSQIGDSIVVRDTQGGPRIFSAINTLGDYDILKDDYYDRDGKTKGKIMSPYIDSSESVIGIPNNAYLIFEL